MNNNPVIEAPIFLNQAIFTSSAAVILTKLEGKNRKYTISIVAGDKWFPNLKELLQMGATFFLVMIAWVFFRSESMNSAFNYLFKMILEIGIPSTNRSGVIYLLILIIFDWLWRFNDRDVFNIRNIYFKNLIYLFIVYSIISHFQIVDTSEFLYFKF